MSNLHLLARQAGILSFPFAAAKTGSVLVSILTLVFAFFNAFTGYVLCRYSDHFSLELGVRHTYHALMDVALGGRGLFVSSMLATVGSFGSLIGYMIIIGDLWNGALSHRGFVGSRAFASIIFGAGIALPLTCFSRIHSLRGSSLFALLTVLFVVFAVVFEATSAPSQASLPVAVASGGEFKWAMGLPIIVFSLGNHLQVVPVFLGLKSTCTKSPLGTMRWVFASSSGLCAVLYLLTGLAGLWQFGPAVAGNVLTMYPDTAHVVTTAKILMALHIGLAYPLVLFPFRRAVDSMIHLAGKRSLLERQQEDRHSHDSLPWVQGAVLNTVIVGVTATIACTYPHLQIVFGLLGATVSVGIIFAMPAALLWTTPLGRHDKKIGFFFFLLAIAVGVTSTAVTIYETFLQRKKSPQ